MFNLVYALLYGEVLITHTCDSLRLIAAEAADLRGLFSLSRERTGVDMQQHLQGCLANGIGFHLYVSSPANGEERPEDDEK